ncbi:low affinity iron permease family protein [Paraburkholderia sp. GAS334]|uniref:low affinity iron permease family protein n=1 Tax=Paraburkholderia sp. GAS334 TaxID=3035131 RepID=UPI003D21E3F2
MQLLDEVPTSEGWHPRAFDKFASLVTCWAGSPVAFCLAVLTAVAWVVTGPMA